MGDLAKSNISVKKAVAVAANEPGTSLERGKSCLVASTSPKLMWRSNECKRRKIKCNGQTPCRGCSKRESECDYPPSSDRVTKIDKYRIQRALLQEGLADTAYRIDPERDIKRLYAHINNLQKQVNELAATISAPSRATAATGVEEAETTQSLATSQNILGSQVSRTGVSPKWSFSPSQGTAFQGPITSAFSFNVAKSNLKSRGIIEANDGNLTQGPSPAASPFPSAEDSTHGWQDQDADPLSAISKDEACRLCHVYDDEMGIMYPVLSLKQALQLVDTVYDGRTSSSAEEAMRSKLNADRLRDNDEAILKMALACGLTAEAGGRSDLGLALFNSVSDTTKDYMWRSPDLAGTMLIMMVVSSKSLTLYKKPFLILAGYVLFPNGRGDPCVENHRHSSANVFRDGTTQARHPT